MFIFSGETFLFTLSPEIKRYEWVGITKQRAKADSSPVQHQAELFMHADAEMISIGGG